MRWTSGWFVVSALAIAWSIIVLPVRGGRDDQPALPAAERGHQIDDPARDVGAGLLDGEAALGVERRQVVERLSSANLLRVEPVDRVDARQREIALARFRGTDLADERVAGQKGEAPDLLRRHEDVVGAGQVARLRGRAGSRSPRARSRARRRRRAGRSCAPEPG